MKKEGIERQDRPLIAEAYKEVTVLFADIVGFTRMSANIVPTVLVHTLNQLFSKWDSLCETYGLEKIKTIGDCYMAAGGVPERTLDHARNVLEFAVAMMKSLDDFNMETNNQLQLRIGINTGSVVAGVIGTKKFSYDLWGDAVNVASRMESTGLPNRIQVSQTTYDELKNDYVFEERGKLHVKGKGTMIAYLYKYSKNTRNALTPPGNVNGKLISQEVLTPSVSQEYPKSKTGSHITKTPSQSYALRTSSSSNYNMPNIPNIPLPQLHSSESTYALRTSSLSNINNNIPHSQLHTTEPLRAIDPIIVEQPIIELKTELTIPEPNNESKAEMPSPPVVNESVVSTISSDMEFIELNNSNLSVPTPPLSPGSIVAQVVSSNSIDIPPQFIPRRSSIHADYVSATPSRIPSKRASFPSSPSRQSSNRSLKTKDGKKVKSVGFVLKKRNL